MMILPLNRKFLKNFAQYFILLNIFSLSACTVGPDFVRPESTTSNTYSAESLPNTAILNQEMPALWWQLFNAPKLSALMTKALQNSPDLQTAQAKLTQAKQLAIAKEGEYYPSADIKFSSIRQKITGAQFGSPNMAGSVFSLYDAALNVSYTFDVFGGIERQLEGLLAEVDYQKFQLDAAFLTLSSNIVLTAIEEAAIREQLKVSEDLIKSYSEQLTIVKQQANLGGASQVEVLAQQTALEQQQSALPVLQKQLQQTRYRLAVLVGNEPSQETQQQFTFADLTLPSKLPVSLPAQLAAQRPDIRAQEALLHAANANIGAMIAKMFPDLTLTANLGTVASLASSWFMPGSAVWNVGGSLVQPLFHGWSNLRQRDAAIAAYQAACAQYRSTVLHGLQNVADVLTALKHDGDALIIQTATVDSANASLRLAKTQYQTGATSYLALLNAENAYQQARLGQIKAHALQLTNAASLFAALGGGWWQRPALPAQAVKPMPLMGN